MVRQSTNMAPASLPVDRVRECLQASRPPVERQVRLKMAAYLTRSLHASMSPRHEGLRWTRSQYLVKCHKRWRPSMGWRQLPASMLPPGCPRHLQQPQLDFLLQQPDLPPLLVQKPLLWQQPRHRWQQQQPHQVRRLCSSWS